MKYYSEGVVRIMLDDRLKSSASFEGYPYIEITSRDDLEQFLSETTPRENSKD